MGCIAGRYSRSMFASVSKNATTCRWRSLARGSRERAVAIATTANVERRKWPTIQPWSRLRIDVNAKSAKVSMKMLSNSTSYFKSQGYPICARRPHTVNYQFGVDSSQPCRCVHQAHISGRALWNGAMLRLAKLARFFIFLAVHFSLSFFMGQLMVRKS